LEQRRYVLLGENGEERGGSVEAQPARIVRVTESGEQTPCTSDDVSFGF
jgi:hypothetical protein